MCEIHVDECATGWEGSAVLFRENDGTSIQASKMYVLIRLYLHDCSVVKDVWLCIFALTHTLINSQSCT